MLKKIISGGQTGVDRAALDVALRLEFPCGGWCPHGRLAEDGPLSDRYPLNETTSKRYSVRTRQNVLDSDGTLILTTRALSGGTALTEVEAIDKGKPARVIQIGDGNAAQQVQDCLDWIETEQLKRLNVAGPRESSAPGIYRTASEWIARLLKIVIENADDELDAILKSHSRAPAVAPPPDAPE